MTYRLLLLLWCQYNDFLYTLSIFHFRRGTLAVALQVRFQ